jgi:dTDP-4-dehydrorhamnose reductase
MKTLLVTGASGLVGGHAAVRASGRFWVWAAYGSHPVSFPNVQSIALDLSDERSIRSVFERVRPDILIHCAAWSKLDECERNPRQSQKINVTATQILAELCAESGVPDRSEFQDKSGCRMIFTSSDMVFDGNRGNYSESDEPNPIQLYGRQKLEAERKIARVLKYHAIARLALVYGKSLNGGRSFSGEIVEKLERGDGVTLFTDQFRTPILVQNAADGLVELAEHAFTGIVHLGGPERISRFEFGAKLVEARGLPKSLIQPRLMAEIPSDAPRPKDVSLDTSLARRTLSIRFVGVDEGVKEA